MEYVCAEIDRLRLGMVGLVGYSSVKGGGRKERTGWIGLTLPGIFLFFLFKKKRGSKDMLCQTELARYVSCSPKKNPHSSNPRYSILFYSMPHFPAQGCIPYLAR